MRYSPWSKDEALSLLSLTSDKPGPVLISLQSIQTKFGFVPKEAIPLIAQSCNVSRAEVHGVLSFYSDLRSSPPPDQEILVCVAEACQAVGSRSLVRGLEEKGIDHQEIFCFGNCALGPNAAVNGKLLGRVSVDSIVNEINA